MKKLFLLSCLIFCCFTFLGKAQFPPDDKQEVEATEEKPVKIIADQRINRLIEEAIEINEKQKTIPGFRVQLYESPVRTAIFERQGKFLNKHPDVAAYVVYQQPTFRLRVGDFESRLDALKLWNEIRADFPSSYVIQDQIQIIVPQLDED